MFYGEKYWLLISSHNTYLWSAKKPNEKKSKEDEQTLAELSSAHRRS